MIYRGGQAFGQQANVDVGYLMGILSSSNEDLLRQIGGMVAEKLSAIAEGRIVGGSSAAEPETEESLRSLAKAMGTLNAVDGTNITDLGRQERVGSDKGKADKTLDLLDGVL
jgi:hypothetical protein